MHKKAVNFYEYPKFKEHFRPTLETHEIDLVEIQGQPSRQAQAKIHKVTTDKIAGPARVLWVTLRYLLQRRNSNMRAQFRRRLEEGTIVVVPGVVDGLSAKIAEQVGFEALYMTGYGVAATFGRPDVGLLTMTETVARAAQIVDAVQLPVIVDADDGYGNALNVIRTVREFEKAGVAVVQLEDQAYPKKCGSYPAKRVIAPEEMVGKIKAALDTRTDPDLLIMARTDAAPIEGLDAAIERAVLYAEAGADLLLAMRYCSEDELKRYVIEVPIPIVALNSESLTMPLISVSQLDAMGIRIVLFPLTAILCSAYAIRGALQEIKKHGIQEHLLDSMYPWAKMNELTGLKDVERAEENYGVKN